MDKEAKNALTKVKMSKRIRNHSQIDNDSEKLLKKPYCTIPNKSFLLSIEYNPNNFSLHNVKRKASVLVGRMHVVWGRKHTTRIAIEPTRKYDS